MRDTKRQVFPGGLWVVATPIGNLQDLTPRAREALETAEALLCEDTRETAKLTHALGLGRRMTDLHRFDAHSGPDDCRYWVKRMQEGAHVVLVSDAGTPGISDPGAALVAAAVEAGLPVSPLPGPSAVATLLSVSGFLGNSFAFRGFFPRERVDREKELGLLSVPARLAGIVVWFESPRRIAAALGFFAERLPAARLVVAKELTKLHEKFFRGNASEVFRQVENEISAEGERGEWCFAVESPEPAKPDLRDESSEWVKALRCLLDAQVPASTAAKGISQHFGAPRNTVYEMALKFSGKKNQRGD
jgi:16S rRNA (cytidine1402-2'-O)-methyltransferase